MERREQVYEVLGAEGVGGLQKQIEGLLAHAHKLKI